MTMTAVAQSHTLTYRVDGQVYETYSLAAGEAIVHPTAPSKAGHTFLGWSTSTNLEQIDLASNADAMLYSNAPCKTDQYGDQFVGWHVLFDGSADTFFHSDYSGADSEDGLDHYLRVDMGEGKQVSIFTFSYTNRNSNCHINAPKTIVVEGSNEADGEYAPIATLTGLPSANSAVYESSLLGNGNDYRYIRFRVTATQQNQMKAGHPFFFISEFEMYQVTPAPVVMPANDLTLYARFRMYNSDIEQNGIFYDIVDEEAHTVEVTTCQSSLDGYSGVLDIPSTVTYNGEEYTVIGAQSGVLNAGSIKSVHIPATFGTVPANMFTGNKTITSVTIGDGITSIGSKAFVGCSALTDVEIPGSVTTIAGEAFADCSALTSIVIPSSVTSLGVWAFHFCSSLESVEIQGEITTIDSYVFGNCTSLKSITIPSSVTSIGYAAFYACSSLENVEIPASVTTIGEYAFSNCYDITNIDIPNSVTSIGDYAFQACELTDIVIPSSVTSIGVNAFNDCSTLKTVVNLSSLTFEAGSSDYGKIAFYADKVVNAPGGTMVGDYLFATINGVNTLAAYFGDGTELVLPANYNGESYEIADYVFADLDGFDSLVIPAGVEHIGNYAFNGCTSLKNLRIEDGETELLFGSYHAFPGCPLETLYIGRDLGYKTDISYIEPTFASITTLKNVTFGDYVTVVDEHCFWGCTGLTGIELSDNIKVIDACSFRDCTNLSYINLNNVESISVEAFAGCTALTDILIPASVTDISVESFLECTNLKTVINFSNLTFTAGSEDNGYVAYYADKVINAPGGTIVGDYVFTTADGVNTLVGYIGYETELVLPENFNGQNYVIGATAFAGDTNLTSLTIPASVTAVETDAFLGCTGLNAVYIDNLAAWCNIDFQGVVNSNPLNNAHNLYVNGELLTELVIPDGITEIKNETFRGCNQITSLTIPEGVTTIGQYAFNTCTALTQVTFPESLTTLRRGAFSGCTALEVVVLPAAVTELEYSVFMACTSLVDITSLATTPPAVVWGTLTNIASNATLYVPRDCGAAYAATDWSQVPNIVELAFNLVYKVNGTVYASERYDYGAAVTPIADPELTGYTFIEWDGIPDYMPRHDVEVNAILEKSADFITIGQYGTTVYTSQYALDFSEVEGLKAYVATGYDTATGEITMTRMKKVNAGVGLYLVGEANTTYAVPYIDYSTSRSLNMLVGVLKKSMVNAYSDDGQYANYKYTIKSGDKTPKFYQYGDGSSVSAGKAYLQIPTAWFEGMASETVGIRFDEGELTDINEIEGEIEAENVKSKTIYDLQGRAVENPAHGIYIIDGQKVFIK